MKRLEAAVRNASLMVALAVAGGVAANAQTTSTTVRMIPPNGSQDPADLATTWQADCIYQDPHPAEPPNQLPNPWHPVGEGWWSRFCISGWQPVLTDVEITPEGTAGTGNRFYIRVVTNDGSYLWFEAPVQIGQPNTFTLPGYAGSVKGSVVNFDGSAASAAYVGAFTLEEGGPPGEEFRYVFRGSTTADASGQFDFTRPDARSQNNHWGLPVESVVILGTSTEALPRSTIGHFRNYYFFARDTVAELATLSDIHLDTPPSAMVSSNRIETISSVRMPWPSDTRDLNNDTGQEEENPEASDGDQDPCPKCVGEPVNVITGDVFLTQNDAVLRGINRVLEFSRTYHSQDAQKAIVGAFGRGWTHSLEKSIEPVQNTATQRLVKSDGSPAYFAPGGVTSSLEPLAPARERSRLSREQDGTFTRQFLFGGSERYDAAGRLEKQADRLGRETTLERDASGHLTRITIPGGRSLTLTYAGDLVSTLSGPGGLVARFDYDGDRLSAVTYADGSGFDYAYDGSGNLLSVSDKSGRVVEAHTYDAEGRGKTSEVGGGRQKLTLVYQADRTLVTDELGATTTYEHTGPDPERHVYKVTGPAGADGSPGATEWWHHDALGRVVQYVNGAGETTSYDYDTESGAITLIQDNANAVTTYTRDALGRVLTRRDPGSGAQEQPWTWAYAGTIGPSSITDPTGRTVAMTYDALGRLRTIAGGDGHATTMEYNAFGDIVSLKDAMNRVTRLGRDADGRVTAIRDDLDHETAFSYDARGRLLRVTLADGSHYDFDRNTEGRVVGQRDPLGRATRLSHQADDTVAAIQDPLGFATQFGYDVNSSLTSLTDARGQTTRFERDALGRVQRLVHPDGADESYEYDAAGRLTKVTDRRGLTTQFRRDRVGRVVEKIFSDGTPALRLLHDASGRLTSAANGSDTLTWTYDAAGRVLSERSARNESVVEYVYDSSGRLTDTRLNGASVARYEYNHAGQLQAIARGESSFGLQYDSIGRRSALTYPNGVVAHYAHDARDYLTAVTAQGTAGQEVGASYTLDAVGNRATKAAAGAPPEAYSYDAADRLVRVDRTGPQSQLASFAYDPVGNRTTTQVGGTLLTGAFGLTNQLQSLAVGGSMLVSGTLSEPGTAVVNGQPARMLTADSFEASVPVSQGTQTISVLATDRGGRTRTNGYEVDISGAAEAFTYDANGSLIQRTIGSETWTYEWNGRNELAKVNKNGVELARFTYDPLGRRIEKATAGTVYSYVYSGLDVLRESRSDGTIRSYVHGPGIDEVLAHTSATGEVTYYHADGLGSIVAMTDAAGNVTSRRQYDAWGNLEVGADQAGYAFTGREWDPETGLYYYRARYYDPKIGRFISEDPIRFAAGPNFYAYVSNNPVSRIDPLGLDDIWGDPAHPPMDPPLEIFSNVVHHGVGLTAWAYGIARWAWDRSSAVPGDPVRPGVDDPQDAYRHCIWSCQMQQSLGSSVATFTAAEHERAGNRSDNQPADREAMDQCNNRLGREAANSPLGCENRCYQLLQRNQLNIINQPW